MEIRPKVGTGVTIGAGASLLLTLTALLLARRIVAEPVSLTSFTAGLVALALLVGGGLVLFWTWSLATLRYRMADDHLSVRWGYTEHLIPYSAITEVRAAARNEPPPLARGVDWPGYHLGSATTGGTNDLLLVSAHLHPRELLYVTVGSITYALSVPDPERMAHELLLHRENAEPAETTTILRQPQALALPMWQDRPAHGLLGLGLLANAALFAYVTYVFPGLPALVPLRFAMDGAVGRVGQREELLMLPVAALAILLINTVVSVALHRRERLGAYLSLGAATLVQVFIAAAVVRIIG
ncbi:MAG: PH domain-containing protein [Chloroflexi bacterium]|nr:PH domain-containing protein [Chloroflexota bacterium]